MPDAQNDTQAQRKPESEGLANTPQDAADGAVKPPDGSMDPPGTEVKDAAAEPDQPEPEIDGSRGM